MTNQEKKTWLQQYRLLDRQIQQKADEIAAWRTRAEKVTPSYSKDPCGGGGDRIQSAVDKILQLESEAQQEIDRLLELERKIKGAIATLEDPILRLLLKYRYIDGLTWEKIAERLQFELRWTYQLHSKALDKLLIEVQHGNAV